MAESVKIIDDIIQDATWILVYAQDGKLDVVQYYTDRISRKISDLMETDSYEHDPKPATHVRDQSHTSRS